MTSIFDLAPVREPVKVRDTTVYVTGLSAKNLVPIVKRFPEIKDMMIQRAVTMTPDRMFELVPQAAIMFIAGGIDREGHEEAATEAVIESLLLGEQLSLLAKVWEVSFPLGWEDAVSCIERLMGAEESAAVSEDTGKAQDTTSSKASPS